MGAECDVFEWEYVNQGERQELAGGKGVDETGSFFTRGVQGPNCPSRER